jgi:hypothetical protein
MAPVAVLPPLVAGLFMRGKTGGHKIVQAANCLVGGVNCRLHADD